MMTMTTGFFEQFIGFDERYPLLFTQFQFWFFFAVVMAVLSFLQNRIILRNAFLFFASIFFYFKTSGLFFILLLFNIVSVYYFANWMYRTQSVLFKRFFLIISILINLGILFYFKYAYFFTDVYNNLFHTEYQVVNWLSRWSNEWFGTHFRVDMIVLPVGISFYTFQSISYVMDVYKGRIEPTKRLLDFGFYVSFFPQLVAGPIVRANEFMQQMQMPYRVSRFQFGLAIFWILNGLVKKIVLGDYLAVNFIDRVFANPLMYSGFENLMAIIGYSLQVYADFSGYTDIAIGVALLMGFYLPVNFNAPYKATNPAEFWKRWHMSLSTWLKDYLYIPLGGNRKATFGTFFWLVVIIGVVIGLSRSLMLLFFAFASIFLLVILCQISRGLYRQIITNINIMVTMLLGGLWHGASWNFIIWGGLNGLGIVAYKFWRFFKNHHKVIVTGLLLFVVLMLNELYGSRNIGIFLVWSFILFAGAVIGWLWSFIFQSELRVVKRAWGILVTFIFITFTRIFFRAGSNLNPAQANQTAIETAQQMIHQLNTNWPFHLIPDMLYVYRFVFILMLIGYVVHWLPQRFKRAYRITFARLPVPVLVLVTVIVVIIVFQFVVSDLQPFIYFQF